ncbi:MAG: DUF308 domain-containing protein [Patescibacteria group bacterium]|jgi:uncharacterized membrane protein HdeD (DUF308 family)|nr:DUF308 domain-containing protein [Patescibacteria group bacterium]
MNKTDKELMKQYWWMMVLRGIAAILFGLAALLWPGLTLLSLIYLFVIFLIVSGVVDIIVGIFSVGKHTRWFLTVLMGILELGFGVYLIRHTGVTIATFILLTGFILIFRGILEVVGAFVEGVTATEKTLAMIAGVVTVLAGVIILFQPTTTIAFVWVLGLFALISGPVTIAIALDVKAAAEKA